MKTDLPVYLITGFLEAGKTKFIQEMLADREFNTGEKTLLLVCEDGIEEYEPELFYGQNVQIEVLESEEELTADNLAKLLKKHPYERLIVEYNGMWPLNRLYDALPDGAFLNDQIMLVDAGTFENYNANMRQLTVGMLTGAAFVLFNRCTDAHDVNVFHKIVRGSNRRCQICYEYTDGRQVQDTIEDPLPFDVNARVIKIEDADYALFYRDLTENMARYDGKTVIFKGVCATDRKLPFNQFVIGRHVMTCCAADITYMGLVAVGSVIAPPKVKDYDWNVIEAELQIEKNQIYRGKGPVLHVKRLTPSVAPENPVATFY